MLCAVDFATRLALLLVDLILLGCGKLAAVGRAVGLDLFVDGGFALLQPGRLACAELAGRNAISDSVLLVLAPRTHFALRCRLRTRVVLVGVDLFAHLILLLVDDPLFLAGDVAAVQWS